MKPKINLVMVILLLVITSAYGQKMKTDIPQFITIPDKVVTSLGALDFKDGAPSAATAQKLYDNLDFLHAQNVFLNTFQGASTYCLGEGFHSVGAEDNSFIIFSDLWFEIFSHQCRCSLLHDHH
jgi:hypothetical protein